MELFDYRRPHVGIKMTPESLFQELLRKQSSFIFADFSVSFCHGMPLSAYISFMLIVGHMCKCWWKNRCVWPFEEFILFKLLWKHLSFHFPCLIICRKFQWGKVWNREILEVISVAFQDSRDIFCAKKEDEHMWGLLQMWNIILRVSQRPLYNNLDFRIYYIG